MIGTDQEDQEKQPGQANTGQTASQTGGTGGNVTGGGSGFVSGGTGQGATTSAKSSAPTSSGNFTNLTSYLDANQGSGATNGKAVENVVDQAGKSADSAVTGYQTAGVNQANAGAVGVDQSALDKISGGAGTFDQGAAAKVAAGVKDGTFTNPNLPKPTYTGGAAPTVSYGGPSDASSLTGDAANAKQSAYKSLQALVGQKDDSTGQYHGGLVDQTKGGQAGVASLLKDTYTQPSYTAGENGLDAFLTGGTAGGQAALSKIQSDWGGEGAKFDAAGNAIGSAITNAKATTEATKGKYQKAFDDAQTATTAAQTSYDQAVKAAKLQAAQQQAAKNSMVAKKTITDAQPSDTESPLIAGPASPTLPGGGTIPMPAAPATPDVQPFHDLVNAVGAGGNNVDKIVTGKKKLF